MSDAEQEPKSKAKLLADEIKTKVAALLAEMANEERLWGVGQIAPVAANLVYAIEQSDNFK